MNIGYSLLGIGHWLPLLASRQQLTGGRGVVGGTPTTAESFQHAPGFGNFSCVFSAVCAFVEYFPQISAEKICRITAESPLQVCENQRPFSAEICGKYSTAGSTTLIVKISEAWIMLKTCRNEV
jgi:hypothetical protein